MRRSLFQPTLAAAIAASVTLSGCAAGLGGSGDAPDATGSASSTSTAAPTPSASPEPTATDPTHGLTSFYDAGSTADIVWAQLNEAGDDEAAALVQRIAEQPVAVWLNGTDADPAARVAEITASAAAASQIALFVVYNIPGRDCGLYSAGGAAEDEYLDWVASLAAAVDPDAVAWFILEPDALPSLGACDGQGDRVGFLAGAAQVLDEAGAEVFLDVGHSHWQSAATMAERVAQVGTEHLAGLETNTSNYNTVAEESAFGDELTALTGLPYLIDTSRNGNGPTPDYAWCNPRGRALGANPQIAPGTGALAYVWAKVPGESDGECNGGPAAGAWWQEIAEELSANAG